MRLRLFWPVLLLCAAAPAARALVEHQVVKKFTPPTTGAVLLVDTFSGAITVTESDGDSVEVIVTEQCDEPDEAAAAAKFANLDLVLAQDRAGGVSMTATYRRKVTFTWEKWPPVVLAFVIKVPRRCDVDLRSQDGDITVGKLRGAIKATNETGKIFIGETEGAVTVRSRAGEIGITAGTGRLDVTTLTGNISIGRAPGGARLASDGGDIEVQQAGGDFRVDGNGSHVKVRFTHPLAHPAEVVTSGGSIIAIFDQRTAASVAATASVLNKVTVRGLVSAGVPDGETRTRLTAKLNGGGPVVTLRAGGGQVLMRGEPPTLAADTVKAEGVK